MIDTERLEKLLQKWKDAVEFFARSEYEGRFYIYDYLNDMDGREAIEKCLSELSDEERRELIPRVEEVDSKLKEMTVPTERCIWGEENALEHNWTPAKNWWYYRRPKIMPSGWGWGWDEVVRPL